ncbi:hypothetical protein [Flaviaesturariibacter aridisoli]|uniref:DoxX family protein n=1 Tax=Flaviaesturariibacter aridisoli TaxID=2545761 RepID=A0A4R4E7G8_9BACT|nr:hypothetical protein [Flaviaesturariibacter aridisoli]TCZ73665.1 hypothetical protein E0486_05120 [Flaviaesturariibacter aridisoli]
MRRSLLYRAALLFALLVALLLPFPWQLASFQQHLLPAIFGPGLYSSDSSPQAALYGALVVVAWGLALLLRPLFLMKPGILRLLQLVLTAWLAAVLARYGADKLFKTQFYLPEPSTLYTPLGFLDKDILYWSTIGTARPYNLFLGGTEVLAAALLLWRRTRRAGLLLALTVLVQVLAVDLCFGIGVRLFSGFLLLLTLLLLAPDARSWIAFLTGEAVAGTSGETHLVRSGETHMVRSGETNMVRSGETHMVRSGETHMVRSGETHMVRSVETHMVRSVETHMVRLYGRYAVLGLIALEALWPALRSGNWNDDVAARPPLHGAWAVLEQATQGQGGLPPAQRLLVHRAGYFVLQDSLERLHPHPYNYDSARQLLHIGFEGGDWRSYRCRYRRGDSLLLLFGNADSTVPLLRARALDWRALPALQ